MKPDFTKQAKELLKDLKSFSILDKDEKIEYINKELQITYLEGYADSLNRQTK